MEAKVQKSTLEQIQPLKIIKGGAEPGVWGVELLAIRYAAWIKPEFEIEVYEVFKTVVRLGVGAMSRLNRIDHIINTETKAISQCASQMAKWGVGGRKRLLHVARERAANEVQMYLPGMV
ncbi:KilA-N domain-containing protein [Escherichia coli]|nr:KilA-N domain-containing protein [Escherichia coli]